MRDGLFDIHIIKMYLGAAQFPVREHLPLPRQQPQFIHLREFGDDAVGHVERNAVVTAFNLVEVFAACKPDMAGEVVG